MLSSLSHVTIFTITVRLELIKNKITGDTLNFIKIEHVCASKDTRRKAEEPGHGAQLNPALRKQEEVDLSDFETRD